MINSLIQSNVTSTAAAVSAAAAAATTDAVAASTALNTSYASAFALSGTISPTGLGDSSTNNYNPAGLSGASCIRQSVTGEAALTGLAGGADGRILVLHNIATNPAFTLALVHNSGSSTASNKFLLPANTNILISPNGSVTLRYDGTSAVWRVIGQAV